MRGQRESAAPISFTRRERAVIGQILGEASNDDIAKRLGCSVKTVEYHVGNILRKVGAKSRVGLVLRLLGSDVKTLLPVWVDDRRARGPRKVVAPAARLFPRGDAGRARRSTG